ncbi:hypothetical protein [Pleionea sp. CnH1-48]|uniref:hypothetical protein n=1 Tax=Pleionea sp. CnH1-48 TaxID=2954494 RepID=UPI00209770A7|nr:hypothetical protein [Pleionea sp. CnH1-48]MCO7223347.1 hypothetical protein [Pleionea sp. CnH1-48]
MKTFISIVIGVMALPAIAGKDVNDRTVNYVYQPDLAPTEFEFSANRTNACGTDLYRVQSPDEATADRKFSLVLAAFTTKKKLSFHDTEVCKSGRAVVSWVKLVN